MKSRWVFALDRSPAISIGWVSGRLGRRSALAIARILSGHHRSAVRVYRVRGPVSRMRGVIGYPIANPTLVHHGLARAARWHVLTETGNTPVADLYLMNNRQARAVGQAIADALGLAIRILDNDKVPRELSRHRLFSHRRPRRRNPAKPTPAIGQWWKEFQTGRTGTITSIGPTTVALLDRNGKRFTVDRFEFRATWNPLPRPNARRSSSRRKRNPTEPDTFRIGDEVSISHVRYFGRHGVVVNITYSRPKTGPRHQWVFVRVNLIDRVVKFHPSYLRLANARRRVAKKKTHVRVRTKSRVRARRSRSGMNSRRRIARSRSRDRRGRFLKRSSSSAASSRSFTRATSTRAA